MLTPILFGVITALLGAGAITLLEGFYHESWWTNIVIRVGDAVFLALYNAFTVSPLLKTTVTADSVIIGIAGSLLSLLIYQFLETHLREGQASGAVFYHEFFTATESFYVVLTLLLLPLSIAHLFLAGYILTFIIGFYTCRQRRQQ